MGNKFIKIVLLVLIVSLAITIASFVINDISALKKNYDEYNIDSVFDENNEPKYLLTKNDINLDINRISLDLINSEIEFKVSDRYSYEIYTSKKLNNIREYGTIGEKYNKLNIEQNNKHNNLRTKIIIFVPLEIKLYGELEVVNGHMTSDVIFEELEIDMVNGVLDLMGEFAYDLKSEITNGEINLNYGNYDAKINIDMVTGELELFDKSYLFGILLNENLIEVLGKADKYIDIEMLNGVITIQ